MLKKILLLLTIILLSNLNSFIKETRMIRMRDGVRLATDIYYPVTSLPPWPAIISRTPYGRDVDSLYALLICDVMKYVLVMQNLRGTDSSEGQPMLFLSDGWGTLQDGYDAIGWIASQIWSNRKIAMLGASAHGMTQYYAAGALPPRLVCCAPIVAGPSLYHHVAYGGGEFRKALVETWVNNQGFPWLIDTIANHPNYDTIFWGCVDLSRRYNQCTYPMYHIDGWYDMYTDGVLEAFSELQKRHHNQKLFVGPWGHGDMWNVRQQGDLTYPPNSVVDDSFFIFQILRWYDYWLKGDSNSITQPRVKFYLMGDCDTQDTTIWNRWITADTWPLRSMKYQNYYLRRNGLLDTIMPQSAEKTDTFNYDPRNPCPTIGGREFIGIPGGYGPKDQRPIEGRSDVVVYTTPVLNQPLAVIGKLRMVLYASSNRRDTDWAVRVSDVYPDGRSILVTDHILMARHRHGLEREDLLTPNIPDTFNIDLWSTALVFNRNHRIRVSITSSNYPRFERNPNTGNPFRRNDTLNTLVATNVIYHTPQLPSHLLLPIVPINMLEAKEVNQQKLLKPEGLQLHVTSPTKRPIIEISAPTNTFIELSLFEISGRKIARIYRGLLPAEHHQFLLKGNIPAGVYFIQLKTRGSVEIKKIVIIK